MSTPSFGSAAIPPSASAGAPPTQGGPRGLGVAATAVAGPADFSSLLLGHEARPQPAQRPDAPASLDRETPVADDAAADPEPGENESAPLSALAFAWPPHLMPPPPPTPPAGSVRGGPASSVSEETLQHPPSARSADTSGANPAAPCFPAPALALAPTSAVSPLTSDTSVAQGATAFLAAPGMPGAANSTASHVPAPKPASASAENLAASLGQPLETGASPTSDPTGENFLPTTEERLTQEIEALGTEDAKHFGTMPSRSHLTALAEAEARAAGPRPSGRTPTDERPAARAPALASDTATEDGDTAPAAGGPVVSAAASPVFLTPQPASPHQIAQLSSGAPTHAEADSTSRELPGAAADAAAAIGEVVELTHEFRARERSSVEVKFHFSDATDLSVRVACRGGEVSVAFHTDSPELRATLGREWQELVAATSAGLESRGLRLADPIFTGSPGAADPSADNAGSPSSAFSQRESDPRHSDHRASADGHGAMAPLGRALRGLGSAARDAFAPATASSAWFRPDTVRHLLAFA